MIRGTKLGAAQRIEQAFRIEFERAGTLSLGSALVLGSHLIAMLTRIPLLLIALLALHTAWSQRHPVHYVEWPAAQATVFGRGAWVEHVGQVSGVSGEFVLILDGITTQLDDRTVQVELPESWRLVGTQFATGVRPGVIEEVESFCADAEQDIDALRQTVAMRKALHATYEEELLMIQSNRQLSRQETLLMEDMRDAADFWRNRVKELKYKQLELDQEVSDLADQIASLEHDIQEQRQRLARPTGQIRLRIQASAASTGALTIRYLTQSAYWLPEYDVAIAPDGAILFDRFASVAQTTGEDWEGIPVEFVVGNPLSTLAPPPFERWVLQHRSEVRGATASAYMSMEAAPREAAWMMDAFDDKAFGEAAPGIFSTDRFRFNPAVAPFVTGTGERERVFIESFELPGKLSYLLLPYASDEAFQLASSDRWATSRLLPGRVQVEAGGAFRGWFDLLLPAPGDTLVVPIGQDPEVRCSRERLADRCSTSAFGGKHKSEQTWVIEVENQHGRPVEVRIEDRIPLAYRPDVLVELLDADGAVHDATDGKLTWNVTLQPGERRSFTVRYRIEYPKGLSIVNF